MNETRWLVAIVMRNGNVLGVFDAGDGSMEVGTVNDPEGDVLTIDREELPQLITMLQQAQDIFDAEEAGLQ